MHSSLIFSGIQSFSLDVPIRLYETGEKKRAKPLILYLHGFGDQISSFSDECSDLIDAIEAYHLFIQGPYPLYDRKREKRVEDWGRSWYLYDGRQKQFLESLGKTSEFIRENVENITRNYPVTRCCMIGYSMGGYLGSYFAFMNPEIINELIVAGCRIKSEILDDNIKKIKHIQILALHGTNDKVVDFRSQKEEIRKLSEFGIECDIKLFDLGHTFTDKLKNEIRHWLMSKGYALKTERHRLSSENK